MTLQFYISCLVCVLCIPVTYFTVTWIISCFVWFKVNILAFCNALYLFAYNKYFACAVLLICCRGFAARSTPAEETELNPTAQEKPLQEPKSAEQPGWFSRFYRDNIIDTGHEQHSSRLAHKDTVYELQCNYLSFISRNRLMLLCVSLH